MDGLEFFEKSLNRLDTATVSAVQISESNIGVVHTGRQNRALFLLAKLIAHNMSMLTILNHYNFLSEDSGFLDHFSIAALARTSIDASLMALYISHPTLTEVQWNLRRNILYYHDLTNRKRFLAAAVSGDQEQPPFFENYKEQKDRIRSKIVEYAKILRYPKNRIDEFVKGQLVYVEGSRGAAREAGWDVNQFEFYQSYLSAYVHSHPVSFMRAEEQKISFQQPSIFQIKFCGMAIDVAASCTEGVVQRMESFCKIEASDPLGHIE